MNLLVVEDEALSRKVLIKIIRNYRPNYHIVAADNGKQALEIIETQPVDMVITDIQMPIMDGLELMKILHEMDKGIKVVVLSGYDYFEYAKKALSYRAMDYILKPIDEEEIISTLVRLENELFFEYQEVRDKRFTKGDEIDSCMQSVVNHVGAEKIDKEKISEVIFQIMLYIKKHFREDLSLCRLAEEFHFNHTYLSKMFKKVLHMTITEYIKSVRLDKAKELLKETNMKIYEVSKFVGYTDYQYFCKIFKQMVKMTPSDYRRNTLCR